MEENNIIYSSAPNRPEWVCHHAAVSPLTMGVQITF